MGGRRIRAGRGRPRWRRSLSSEYRSVRGIQGVSRKQLPTLSRCIASGVLDGCFDGADGAAALQREAYGPADPHLHPGGGLKFERGEYFLLRHDFVCRWDAGIHRRRNQRGKADRGRRKRQPLRLGEQNSARTISHEPLRHRASGIGAAARNIDSRIAWERPLLRGLLRAGGAIDLAKCATATGSQRQGRPQRSLQRRDQRRSRRGIPSHHGESYALPCGESHRSGDRDKREIQ